MALFLSRSLVETEAWAASVAALLKPGMRIALIGNLGAGKTAVVRGLGVGLGLQAEIHSPSYALVHQYEHQPKIYHLDLYRLPEVNNLQDLGLESWDIQEGVTLVEWPERLQDPYWKWDVEIEIRMHSENERWIEWRWIS